MFNSIIKFLAGGLGLGFMPVAPGTFGTVWGSILYYFLRSHPQLWFFYFSVTFAMFSIIIAHLGEKAFKEKDCQKIVIDEVAGVLFCYMLVPYSLFNLVMGFILFRIFDIAKLPPARQAQDKLKGGLGVVGDDLVAGLQGGIILVALPWLMQSVGTGLKWLDKLW